MQPAKADRQALSSATEAEALGYGVFSGPVWGGWFLWGGAKLRCLASATYVGALDQLVGFSLFFVCLPMVKEWLDGFRSLNGEGIDSIGGRHVSVRK